MSEPTTPPASPDDLTKVEDGIELQEEDLNRISGGGSTDTNIKTSPWK
jgi:hypothetical protein